MKTALTKPEGRLSKVDSRKRNLCLFLIKDEKLDEGLGPSIYDLVSAEDVDMLQYIGWEKEPETERKREPVRQMLIFCSCDF